ncbi:hypothetical protein B0A49_13026, partial [Cryomyces minteri]
TDKEAAAKEGLQYLADKTRPSQGLDTSPISPTTVDMLGGAGLPLIIRTPETSSDNTNLDYWSPQSPDQIDDQSTTDREWDEAERVRSHERQSSRYWYKPQQTRTHVEAFGIVLGANGMPGIARGGVPEQANISIPIHNIQPLNDHSSDPLSRFYTELVGAKRLLLAEGYPSDGVLGPADIDVTSLLENRALGGFQNSPSTLCQWAVNSVRGLEGMRMPEKLATILMTARLLRWQVLSTFENYQNLPDCMKPTALQTFVPHPAWINFVPWPDIRDVLITTPEA